MIWRGQDKREDQSGEPIELEGSGAQRPIADTSPSSLGDRVDSVIAAAERAAADIRNEAQEWAQQHVEEARRRADELAAERVQELSTISDDLLKRARTVVRQADDLIAALDTAVRRARRGDTRATDEPVGRPEPVALTDPEPGDKPDGPGSEGARLLAAQMAVAGNNRETITIRLREEFGIEDPTTILDDAGL